MSSKALIHSMLTVSLFAAAALTEANAHACGGFFCSQSQAVNQAAERIVFAKNSDGTVTAVIQIMYQGEAPKFSWLLPISTVPEDIQVASNLAFTRLQSATNPRYSLTTRVEGTCKLDDRGAFPPSAGSGGATSAGNPSTGGGPGGVTVEASGVVGAFEWTVISVDSSSSDPADAATNWLTENGYTVGEGAPGLIRPYLEDGLHLLALKLTKGADVGSIRPIVLTYEADQPMIPIKLTAVAANDDMGVMAWLLSESRGVPQNYNALELNEARINWFNANANYNDVVTAAADEAGGQGFVTEFADASSTLANSVWSPSDDAAWQSFTTMPHSSFGEIFDSSYAYWGQWDGFWDAVRDAVTLPSGVTFEDFQACPNCYSTQVQFAPSEYFAALEKSVIAPVRDVQNLIDAHPYVTRLYTTMSAADMTVDPLFTFNEDLPSVSNVHTAERVIECNPDVYQFEAPWRIELPQGGVVRGTGSQVGTWPDAFAAQPSNARILRQSASGEGRILEDNRSAIEAALDDYNASLSSTAGGSTSSGGMGNTNGGAITMGGATSGGANNGGDAQSSSGASGSGIMSIGGGKGSDGCTIGFAGGASSAWSLSALAALAFVQRRRRRSA